MVGVRVLVSVVPVVSVGSELSEGTERSGGRSGDSEGALIPCQALFHPVSRETASSTTWAGGDTVSGARSSGAGS